MSERYFHILIDFSYDNSKVRGIWPLLYVDENEAIFMWKWLKVKRRL